MSRLKEKRKEIGITQIELAEKVGVSSDYISMIERGDRTPGFSLARRISNELNSTIDEIFFESRTNKTFDGVKQPAWEDIERKWFAKSTFDNYEHSRRR